MQTDPSRFTEQAARKLVHDHKRLIAQFQNLARRLQSMQYETEQGGTVQVHYAQPTGTHSYQSQQDYTTINGETIEDVVNDTGVTLLDSAWYLIWKADDDKWYSKPAQFDQCNPENPIV